MTDLQLQLPSDHNFGLCVDENIQGLEMAKFNFKKHRVSLLDMGVKIVDSVGNVMAMPNLDPARYMACNMQEFAWEAVYEDDTVVKQFEDDGTQHHFGDIDQSRLKLFRWVSNFTTETSNVEKHAVVTLDFKSGAWDFLNVDVSQSTRGDLLNMHFPGLIPKLIMKMVKRESVSGGNDGPSEDSERYLYNRYIIGFEAMENSPVKGKVLLCIEPNGYVHFWHEKK